MHTSNHLLYQQDFTGTLPKALDPRRDSMVKITVLREQLGTLLLFLCRHAWHIRGRTNQAGLHGPHCTKLPRF